MISVQVDMREFNRALKESVLTSSRTVSEVVHGQSLALAKRSLNHTRRANKEKIARILGQTGTKLRRRRSDKRLVKGVRIFGGEGTFAARIIAVKRKEKNLPAIWGDDMAKAVKKFVNARIKSVGFIASGWKWAIADLSRLVGYKDRRPAGKQTKPPKGKRMGQAIRFGRKTRASITIINTALDNDNGKTGAVAVAEEGLRAGVRETIADMRRHMEKRLAKALKKHNAR